MVEIICTDASVIVKFLVPEDDSSAADELFTLIGFGRVHIVMPSFARVEIYSTLLKKHSLGDLSTVELHKAVHLFGQLNIDYQVEDKALLDRALQLANSLRLRVIYDCVYLALAEALKAYLVTADTQFTNKAGQKYKQLSLLTDYVENFTAI